MSDENTYAFITEPTINTEIAVGLNSTIITFARNAQNKRRDYIIRNVSDNDADIISVTRGFQGAVNNSGIVLKKGETFFESSDKYDCYQGVITAICATANGKLALSER
jgi:hypothetical protein